MSVVQFIPPNGIPLNTPIGQDNALFPTVGDLADGITALRTELAAYVAASALPSAVQDAVTRPVLAASPSRRVPVITDDVGLGASVGDLYINRLGAWSATRATAGDAVWTRRTIQIPASPASAISVPPLAAWGIDAVVTGFTGPSIDVATTVNGAVVTTPLPVGNDGTISREMLGALIAASDSGTLAQVTKLYDQTGNGHHLSAITDGRGPVIGVAKVGECIAVAFSQPPNSIYTGLSCTTIPASCEPEFSLTLFGAVGCLNDSHANYSPLASCTSSASTTSFLVYSADDRKPAISVFDYASNVRTIWNRYATGDADVPGFVRSNATLTLWQGGQSSSAPVASSGNTSGTMTLRVGPHFQAGVGYSSPLILTGAALYSQALTPDQWTSLRANYALSVKGNIGPRSVNVMAIGDSRTAGYRNPANYAWPYRLRDSLATDANVTINAVSGITTVDIIGGGVLDAAKSWLSELPSRAISIVTLLAGVNDQGQIGNDPTAISGRIRQIIASLFASGLDYAVLIAEQDQSLLASYETVSQSFGSKCILVNPYAGAMGQESGASVGLLWDDNLHQTPSGDDYLAAYVAPAINSFLMSGALLQAAAVKMDLNR